MTAPKSSIEGVLTLISRYVSPITMLQIIEELKEIPGKPSFKETIERVYTNARRRYDRPGER